MLVVPMRNPRREIRRAFITEPGWKLVSADYSQVELRILAHFSEDPVMIQAFRDGIDIHTRTAAEVFDTPIFAVTSEQRSRAKMVNYGLAYGLTSFGLAQRLSIPRKEADALHRRYFERFPAVKAFQAQLVEEARENQFAKTLMGRIRPLPHIRTRKWNDRKEAERLAINTPIQGTGADILKQAMLNLDRALADREARMVLTVHDELVVECPAQEAEVVAEIMKTQMESAASLRVPLVVEVGIGDNWAEIH
jgi:DNA polymerase-1